MSAMRRAVPFIVAATTGKVFYIIVLVHNCLFKNLRCPLRNLRVQANVCEWNKRHVCAQASSITR